MFYFLKIWNMCGHCKLVSCLCANLSLNESILKKSFQTSISHLKDKIGTLWKTSKTTWFWQGIVTKPLDLKWTTRHHWKDNAHILHLTHGTLTLWNCFPQNQYDITVPETAYGYVMHRKRRQCIFASCDNLFLHVATLSFSNLAAAQDKCEIPTFYFLQFDASFFFFIPEQICGKTKPRNLCALPLQFQFVFLGGKSEMAIFLLGKSWRLKVRLRF